MQHDVDGSCCRISNAFLWKLPVSLLLVLHACQRSVSFVLRPPTMGFTNGPPVERSETTLFSNAPRRFSPLHASTSSDARDQITQHLMDWFQGDFDNYYQVVEDRQHNMQPREGGGHEHFHCTLVPLTKSSRLAAFYFDANPYRIFRFRHYQLIYGNECNDSNSSSRSGDVVEMQLSTLHPDLEQLLRAHSTDPLCWPRLFEEFQPPNDDHEAKMELLPRCEVAWSLERDPMQHAYTLDIPEGDLVGEEQSSLHAVMVYGEAIVNSTIVPGMAIRILDQLSLYPNVFYINDRGFDPLTGAYIYGNQRGVPYRLTRVSHIISSHRNDPNEATFTNVGPLQRQVENADLAWTMGPEWRTEEEYQAKMEAIGGVSAGINKNSYKVKMTKEMSE